MTKSKYFVPVLALVTDIGLAIYSYLLMTNYEKFQKYAKIAIKDPDFQLELYKLILQTMTFLLFVFLFLHLIIYILYLNKNKYAQKYVRFYLIVALLSLGLSLIFSFNFYILIAAVSFGFCFKNLKTAE
jgi:hypothetical protein